MKEDIIPVIEGEFQTGNAKQTSKRIYASDVVDDEWKFMYPQEMMLKPEISRLELSDSIFKHVVDIDDRYMYMNEMKPIHIMTDRDEYYGLGLNNVMKHCDQERGVTIAFAPGRGTIGLHEAVRAALPDFHITNYKQGMYSGDELQELMMQLNGKELEHEKYLSDIDASDFNDGLHNCPPQGVSRNHHKRIMAMNNKGKRK